MSITYYKSVDPKSPLGRKLMLLFLGLGIAFLLIGGILFVSRTIKIHDYVKTDGIITNIDSEGYPRVLYATDDGTLTHKFSVSSISYTIGGNFKLLYDPADPRNVTPAGFIGYLPSAVLGGLGLVFTAVGGFGLAFFGKKKEECG